MSQHNHKTSHQIIRATAGFFMAAMTVMPITANARDAGEDKAGARTIQVGNARAVEFSNRVGRADGSKRTSKKCVATHKRHACK